MPKQDSLKLRKATQARMIDCQQALKESGGDFEKAIIWLRKNDQKIATKRIGKTTHQGAIFAKTNQNNTFGVMLILGCETDFVARNHMFEALGNDLVNIALQYKPTSIETLLAQKKDNTTWQEKLTQTAGTIGENISIIEYHTLSATLIATYVHTGRRLGALVALNHTPNPNTLQAAKNMAMQVVASDPIAIDEHTLDKKMLENERHLIEEKLKTQHRPPAMIEKITQGRLNKFIKENTLLAQPFIKDNTQTVQQYLQNIANNLSITNFKRSMITA